MNIASILFTLFCTGMIIYYARREDMQYKLWGVSAIVFPYVATIVFMSTNCFFKNKEESIARVLFIGVLIVLSMGLALKQLQTIFNILI